MLDTDSATGPVPDPIAALALSEVPGVLAVITRVEGPSYRPVGATMAVFPESLGRVGTLSSGCVESDIALHAAQALEAGAPKTVLYGSGSPFMDIQLPCGGGLEILLLPRPDRAALAEVAARKAARRPCTLLIDRATGALAVQDTGATGAAGADRFAVRFTPELRFVILGKGPEASTFAALVQAAGYPNLLVSPDEETRTQAEAQGCPTVAITGPALPGSIAVDAWSAIVLFFHDHDWEPPILADAVQTDAFYIGSQGSRRARDARMLELEAMGVPQAARDRIRGPIGLVPSARDARTLAVSVLAEVLDTARALPD